MKRMRLAALVSAGSLVVAACGAQLGLGVQACEPSARVPTPANVLAAQAVPTARYTPCFRSLDLGWQGTDFSAENGRAAISVLRNTRVFLKAEVTESCDVGDARPAVSSHPDISKFENVVQVPFDISVVIIPTAEDLIQDARAIAAAWAGTELDDRRVIFTIDSATGEPISERVSRALSKPAFVWLVDPLDVAEATVEMRAPNGSSFPRVPAEDALERIEDLAPDAVYEGFWYFLFEGGCITYTFDASGQLAETVAVDAMLNLGFYPAYELWEIARSEGRYRDASDD